MTRDGLQENDLQFFVNHFAHEGFCKAREKETEGGKELVAKSGNEGAFAGLHGAIDEVGELFGGHAFVLACVVGAVASGVGGPCGARIHDEGMDVFRPECNRETAGVSGKATFAGGVGRCTRITDIVR